MQTTVGSIYPVGVTRLCQCSVRLSVSLPHPSIPHVPLELLTRVVRPYGKLWYLRERADLRNTGPCELPLCATVFPSDNV